MYAIRTLKHERLELGIKVLNEKKTTEGTNFRTEMPTKHAHEYIKSCEEKIAEIDQAIKVLEDWAKSPKSPKSPA